MQNRIINDPALVQQKVTAFQNREKRIGVVPTMGALHEGHLSLVKKSKDETDFTIVTLFVNPTQFGPGEDLDKYPRTLERDFELLKGLETDMVFLPTNEMMYPENFDTFVEPGKIAGQLEGQVRPAHFRGVTTVVLKLFNITKADVAFFGQKDYQQCCVIKKMVDDFNIPIKIEVCPIVRESDGLAMSSRNRYLSTEERTQSLVLSKSLEKAKKMIDAKVTDAEIIRSEMQAIIATAPLAKIDYISFADPNTLDEISEIKKSKADANIAVIMLAVRFGETRLIDNMLIA